MTEEAVAIYRELAATAPDEYAPQLADALDSLARLLAQLGREAEAALARQEAAGVARSLERASTTVETNHPNAE